MMNYENPEHDGNSAKWHTGKQCIEKGCKKPAGTWWSPHWCFDHNVERMQRISAGLNDAVERAKLAELVDKQTAELRAWAGESYKTMKAMVLASGGTLTIKNGDRTREIESESVSYGDDTTTYRYHPRS
ncbi:hypothetical protein ACWAT4_21485 [Bradyrhizobium manausense]